MSHAYLLDTYLSETRKTASVWSGFTDADWDYRIHPKSSSVGDILKHQILSERRFFSEFLQAPESPPTELLPSTPSVAAYTERMVALAEARLPFLEAQTEVWWHETRPFFDVTRERIWILWRRVLHTAHHRTQLTLYLRMLDRPVPSTYGPTADVTWSGADPTLTVEAAGRTPK